MAVKTEIKEIKKEAKHLFLKWASSGSQTSLSALNVEVLNLKIWSGGEVAIYAIVSPPDESDIHQSFRTIDWNFLMNGKPSLSVSFKCKFTIHY